MVVITVFVSTGCFETLGPVCPSLHDRRWSCVHREQNVTMKDEKGKGEGKEGRREGGKEEE